MDKAVLYIHGKYGSASEAEFYKPLFDADVIGLDYDTYEPWTIVPRIKLEFMKLKRCYSEVSVVAVSIGAWFALLALGEQPVKRAFLISPVVDMEKLIGGMMLSSGVSEAQLREKGEIPVQNGEVLSWKYLSYVRENPIYWPHRTEIIYGSQDNLTDEATITAFAQSTDSCLNVLSGGEHWFHTKSQMGFIKHVIEDCFRED